MQHTPKLLDIELLSSGWLNKYRLTYELPDGSVHPYEAASRKKPDAYRRELELAGAGECAQEADAVCIVPRTLDETLVLIREFRYPLNSWCISFPAGLIEPSEEISTCVERELAEETGYRLVRDEGGMPQIRALAQAGYSSTGMTDESVQVVYALVEKDRAAEPEPSEFIEVFELPITEAARFLEENTTPIGIRCQLVLEAYAREAAARG